MTALWGSSLFLGGLVFLTYFWSINFIPEMDLQASITFLIVAALTGTILIVFIVVPLLYPGIYFGLCFKGEKFA